MLVHTLTGSVYKIHDDNWERVDQPKYEGGQPLRTKSGSVLKWVVRPQVGSPMAFLTDSLTGSPRGITTSMVVKIEYASTK